MSHYLQSAIGLALLVSGLSGPFSYADDWRHSGEIAAAVAFALSGLSLALPIILSRSRWIAPSRWAALAILLGLAVGTAADMTVLGVIVGGVVGFVAAWRHGPPLDDAFKPDRLRGSA